VVVLYLIEQWGDRGSHHPLGPVALYSAADRLAGQHRYAYSKAFVRLGHKRKKRVRIRFARPPHPSNIG
jgi:hypothetical protein